MRPSLTLPPALRNGDSIAVQYIFLNALLYLDILSVPREHFAAQLEAEYGTAIPREFVLADIPTRKALAKKLVEQSRETTADEQREWGEELYKLELHAMRAETDDSL